MDLLETPSGTFHSLLEKEICGNGYMGEGEVVEGGSWNGFGVDK